MRTKTSRFPATCTATVLAAIIATAAIGASGSAFAACGVSSGAQTGVHTASVGTGVKTGVAGSTHGIPSSSCPSMTNRTITANASALGGGVAGAHIYTHSGLTSTNHNLQTTHLQTPTRITNKTAKPKT
jgi:hypothetical protein